jgi:hypothetical protein
MTSRRSAEPEATSAPDAGPDVAVSSHVRDTGVDGGEPDIRAAAEARVGQVFAEHRLEELLGVGGTAAVYRALDAEGRPFALKVLHASLGGDGRVRKRFLREAQIAKWLDHPRVARIVATGETPGGAAYHVMDLREGVTLERRRAAAPEGLPYDTVIPWIDDLLSVLAVAHARGITHRDVKPANLLLDRHGRVHVLDFGIMRLVEDQGVASLVTRSGVLLGTVPFMPPEQALGRSEEIDARTDVWAVGATMFSLITGKLVHGGRSVNEALVLAATQPAPPIRQVDPSVPKPLAAVIDKALAFDRQERFADASAMRRALRRAAGLEPPAEVDEAANAVSVVTTLPEESLRDGEHRAPVVAGLPRPLRVTSRGVIVAAIVVAGAGVAVAWALTDANRTADVTVHEERTAASEGLPSPTAPARSASPPAPEPSTTRMAAAPPTGAALSPPGPVGGIATADASARPPAAPAPPKPARPPPAASPRATATLPLPPF